MTTLADNSTEVRKSIRRPGSASIPVPVHGVASDFYLIGIVEQAVTDGIGQGGIPDVRMPLTGATWVGDGGGTGLQAVDP